MVRARAELVRTVRARVEIRKGANPRVARTREVGVAKPAMIATAVKTVRAVRAQPVRPAKGGGQNPRVVRVEKVIRAAKVVRMARTARGGM